MSNFIEKVHIENFKSIDSIDLNCKRINIFIGPPGSGKSNILEAIGLISKYTLDKFPESIRIPKYKGDNEIVYREMFNYKYLVVNSDPVKIRINDGELNIYENVVLYKLDYVRNLIKNNEVLKDFYEKIKFYRFDRSKIEYKYIEFSDFLIPPFGENIFTLLKENKELRKYLSESFFSDMFLKLGLIEGKEDVFIFCDTRFYYEGFEDRVPVKVLSDSILKLIFDIFAIETNKDSIILLDTKVNYNFDFYINEITSRISRSNNQFFIETDNDLFLKLLIEKAGLDNIKVFWTELWGTTQIVEIPEDKLKEFLDKSKNIGDLYSLMKKYAYDYLFAKFFP
ncbi:hypothetical protein YN1_7120 [Nanoarchaeota archaeon]